MEQLSGGEMIMRALRDEGVKLVFGYPGGAVLHIYDAFYRQSDVEHILVRHEQAGVHAADGYARATGEVGVAIVTFNLKALSRNNGSTRSASVKRDSNGTKRITKSGES